VLNLSQDSNAGPPAARNGPRTPLILPARASVLQPLPARGFEQALVANKWKEPRSGYDTTGRARGPGSHEDGANPSTRPGKGPASASGSQNRQFYVQLARLNEALRKPSAVQSLLTKGAQVERYLTWAWPTGPTRVNAVEGAHCAAKAALGIKD
jgi:hypothetical protein